MRVAPLQRAMRRELDRLGGELVRRQDETDACLRLYARRERVRAVFGQHCPCRVLRALWARPRRGG